MELGHDILQGLVSFHATFLVVFEHVLHRDVQRPLQMLFQFGKFTHDCTHPAGVVVHTSSPVIPDARAMLLTAAPTASRDLQRSCCRVWVLLMRVSSLSVDPFSAATIEVIPTAKPVVEFSRSVASLGSKDSWCLLNLGDLDLSSSLPASPSSLSSLSSPSTLTVSCSFSFSESVSAAPACAGSAWILRHRKLYTLCRWNCWGCWSCWGCRVRCHELLESPRQRPDAPAGISRGPNTAWA